MLKIIDIDINSKVLQCEGNIVSDMDGEKVMLNIQNGKYYNLGILGGEIWNLISDPINVNQLVMMLMAEYEINKEECEEQVIAFLSSLHQEGLIKLVE